jgi:hypothetical protein
MDVVTALEVWAMRAVANSANTLAGWMDEYSIVGLLVAGLLLSGALYAAVAVVRLNIYLWRLSRVGYLLAGGVLAWVSPQWPDWSGWSDFFAFAACGVVLMALSAIKALWFTSRVSVQGDGNNATAPWL